MDSKPGTYALVLRSDEHRRLRIGRWGLLEVRPGYYIYVGSALGPGGLSARVSRHVREAKRKHWHIDYLRETTTLVSAFYCYSAVRFEHRWAIAVAEMNDTETVKGFGCSDCKCESHLFYSLNEPRLDGFAAAVGGFVKSWSRELSPMQPPL